MGYLLKINNGKIETIKPKSFEKKEMLQEIVKKFPEIIPLEEIDENFGPLLIIGREFPLETAGSVDLLAIDTSALQLLLNSNLKKTQI